MSVLSSTANSPALQSLLHSEATLITSAVAAEPAGTSLWLSAFASTPSKGQKSRVSGTAEKSLSLDTQIGIGLDAHGDFAGALRASAHLWPISDNACSFVVLQHVLDYAGEPEELLAEAVRSLRGHGVLVICGFRSVSALRLSRSWRPAYRAQAPRFASASGWARACKVLGIADIRIIRLAPMWPWIKNAERDESSGLARYLPNLCSAYVLIGRKRSLRGMAITQYAKAQRAKMALEPAQARSQWTHV